MTWYKTGLDSIDEVKKEQQEQYAASNKPRDFFLSPNTTKRVILLDDEGFLFWQHNLYGITKMMDYEVCLKKNGIGPCALCDAAAADKDLKLWPSYVALMTLIDCGDVKSDGSLEGYQGKKAYYQFGKKVLRVGFGSEEKPGIGAYLRRLKARNGGSLHGAVLDVYRGGKKDVGVGNEWSVVGKIDLTSSETLRAGLAAMPGHRATDMPDHDLIKDLTPDAINYMDIAVPRTPDEMASHLDQIMRGSRYGGGGGGYGGGGYGGGYGGGQTGASDAGQGADDEELPF